jgi:quercetin dioxygenase-like cupin family protein
MIEEAISRRGAVLVRRLVLEPGESTRWHTDLFHRVTVVVRGETLEIEYQDGGTAERVEVSAGQADWDEPTDRGHRAVNVGHGTYEEVVVFFLDDPLTTPQPDAGRGFEGSV